MICRTATYRELRTCSVRYSLNPGDVAVDAHGEICVIDHKAGFCTGRLFHMLFLDIVDFNLFLIPSLGVIGGQARGLLEGAIRQLVCAAQSYDDMGAGNFLGMEPPVITGGNLEGEFIILVIILSHIHMEAIAADIVEGLLAAFCFLVPPFRRM